MPQSVNEQLQRIDSVLARLSSARKTLEERASRDHPVAFYGPNWYSNEEVDSNSDDYGAVRADIEGLRAVIRHASEQIDTMSRRLDQNVDLAGEVAVLRSTSEAIMQGLEEIKRVVSFGAKPSIGVVSRHSARSQFVVDLDRFVADRSLCLCEKTTSWRVDDSGYVRPADLLNRLTRRLKAADSALYSLTTFDFKTINVIPFSDLISRAEHALVFDTEDVDRLLIEIVEHEPRDK